MIYKEYRASHKLLVHSCNETKCFFKFLFDKLKVKIF